MKDFLYLWTKRERPNDIKRRVRVWAKRTATLPSLFRLLVRPFFLRARGAKVGNFVAMGRVKIAGRFSNFSVGDGVSIGCCEIALHDQVCIGKRAVINDGVLLLTASHNLQDPAWSHKTAPIHIGDYAWVASNAIILPGVSIGRGSVVAAGAVVRVNVQDYALAIGNPAIVIPDKRTNNLMYSPALLNAPFEAWVGRQIDEETARDT